LGSTACSIINNEVPNVQDTYPPYDISVSATSYRISVALAFAPEHVT
jgi:hypothetical protein